MDSILVIEDDPNLRSTLAQILHQSGYAVTTASDTQEANQCLRSGQYDLILLDLKLPGNGLTLLLPIRQLQPETPVLILTAHASLDSAITAVRQGVKDYLLKPVPPSELLARIHEVLAETKENRQRGEIIAQIEQLASALKKTETRTSTPSKSLLSYDDSSRILRCGTLTLNLQTRYVELDGRGFSLPPTTFQYLVALARHSPDPVQPEVLVLETQGYVLSRLEAQELVRWRIHEIRQHLEPDIENPRYIITVRGYGYCLVI